MSIGSTMIHCSLDMEFPFIVLNLFSELDMDIQLIVTIELYATRVNFKLLSCDQVLNLINPIVDCFGLAIRSCLARHWL
jgi:hypothetical protein